MGDASQVWLNGRLLPEAEAGLSIFDRGFTLGDGIFETLRVCEGRPLWLDDHLARFQHGAGVLGIPLPFEDRAIRRGLAELIEASGHQQASLRLTLSRGPSRARGLWPPASPATPTLLAVVSPFPGTGRPPLRLIVAGTVRRNEHSPLSLIKSLNYGDNILARREADSRGADDALMMNGQGRITCGTVGNIFLRFAGVWVTPPDCRRHSCRNGAAAADPDAGRARALHRSRRSGASGSRHGQQQPQPHSDQDAGRPRARECN